MLLLTAHISGWLTMFLSFWALRFLAVSMNLLGSTAIARWWQQRRGWVVGLSLVLAALFRWRYLPFLESLIAQHGWRTTWTIIGITLGVIMLPLWTLFMRNRPEQYGLLPDGQKDLPEEFGEKPKKQRFFVEENWTLFEARHTVSFWVFLLSRASAGVIGSGLVLHQVSVFAQVGHSETVAAETFGTVALISVAMTLFVGWLVRQVRPGVLVALHQSLMIATLLLITVMTESWQLTLYALVFGAAWGFGGTFDGTVWADLFGRRHHGTIRGFVTTIHMIGTSIGPVLYGVSYDYFGSYLPVVVVGVTVLSVEIVLCLLVKSPQKRPELLSNAS
jgi:MFS-type transporter involved in bile tolerance (Atg22 family)